MRVLGCGRIQSHDFVFASGGVFVFRRALNLFLLYVLGPQCGGGRGFSAKLTLFIPIQSASRGPRGKGGGEALGARPRNLRPSAGASSAGVGKQRRGRRAAPGSARTRAAGPTRQHLTMVYKAPLRGLGAVPRWVTQVGMPHGKNYQSLSSGSLRVIPSVRNFFL